MNWLGYEFDPSQLEYWNGEHHGSQKRDYEWIKEQKVKRHIDLRWQEFFDPEVAAGIVARPTVQHLLRDMNLEAGEDGLCRMPTEG